MVPSQNPIGPLADDHRAVEPQLVLLTTQQWATLCKRYRMTDREMEVAKLICRGLSNDHIAERLKIKQGTVKTHVRNIYRKTWVNNKIAMLLKFLQDVGNLPLNT